MARDWTRETSTLTQGLVAVLCIAGQPEQRGPHLLTALVQILEREADTCRQSKHGPRWTACLQPVSNVLRLSAHFNELLVALGAALPAEALQQLAQQAHALLHLLDGTLTFGNFLHSLLVLQGAKRKVGIPQGVFFLVFFKIIFQKLWVKLKVCHMTTMITTWWQ